MSTQAELRQAARDAVRASVPDELWDENESFVRELIRSIEAHPAGRHPLSQAMHAGEFDRSALKLIALEFHHAFGQVFPNVVLQAMQLAQQLQARLGIAGASACRFLLQLNLLDELGFSMGSAPDGLGGDPRRAHAVKLRELMEALGVSDRDLSEYRPTLAATRVREAWDTVYADGALLIPLLAVAEMLSQRFFAPAKRTMTARGVEPVDYLDAHMEDVGGVHLDAVHADDLWYASTQFTEAKRRDEIRGSTLDALDRIAAFLDSLAERAVEAAHRQSD